MSLYKPLYCINCKTQLTQGSLNNTMSMYCPQCSLYYCISKSQYEPGEIRQIKLTRWKEEKIPSVNKIQGGVFDE